MTYNIRHGVGLDRVLDLERTARVIQVVDPDILILNEVDHGTERAFEVLQADSLGKILGMHAVFGRSIDYDGGEYGNALLSRFPVLDFRVHDLSTDTILEGRSVFISALDLAGDTLLVLGTHLGLKAEERREQIAGIIHKLPSSQQLILAGDFNFEPDSETYRTLTMRLRDGILEVTAKPENTFPADHPDRRIDYIFIGFDIEALEVLELTMDELTTASDHRPQFLKFRIKQAGNY